MASADAEKRTIWPSGMNFRLDDESVRHILPVAPFRDRKSNTGPFIPPVPGGSTPAAGPASLFRLPTTRESPANFTPGNGADERVKGPSPSSCGFLSNAVKPVSRRGSLKDDPHE